MESTIPVGDLCVYEMHKFYQEPSRWESWTHRIAHAMRTAKLVVWSGARIVRNFVLRQVSNLIDSPRAVVTLWARQQVLHVRFRWIVKILAYYIVVAYGVIKVGTLLLALVHPVAAVIFWILAVYFAWYFGAWFVLSHLLYQVSHGFRW